MITDKDTPATRLEVFTPVGRITHDNRVVNEASEPCCLDPVSAAKFIKIKSAQPILQETYNNVKSYKILTNFGRY